MTKCSSKARKKSESVNRTRHESSDDENSSDQETALSISNRNERSESDSSSSDGEEDDRKRDFGGQSLETESRGSVQNGNPSGGQSPKLDEKDRGKDGYNHFLCKLYYSDVSKFCIEKGLPFLLEAFHYDIKIMFCYTCFMPHVAFYSILFCVYHCLNNLKL